MVSQSQAQSIATKAGLPPDQVQAVVADYNAAQIQALKRALLVASLFVLIGLWFARALPSKPLAREADSRGPPPHDEAAPDRAGAVRIVATAPVATATRILAPTNGWR
jgi:hypothetical protein